MKRKKYYIYAGYYELWISDIKLGRPLTYMGFAYSLENAQLRCEKIDPDVCVCYSESLKDEVGSMFYWIEDIDNAFPFYNEQEYKLSA